MLNFFEDLVCTDFGINEHEGHIEVSRVNICEHGGKKSQKPKRAWSFIRDFILKIWMQLYI